MASRVKMQKQINQTISEKQVKQLLKLQEIFHQHYMTQELLNQLVSIYVKLVQHMAPYQHYLRVYFLQKISFILSRPEIIKILQKEPIKNNNLRKTIYGMKQSCQEDENELRKIKEEALEEVQKNHLINLKKEKHHNDVNEELKLKERNVKIQMQMNIMKEVEENMKIMTKEAQDYQKKQQEISQNIQKQNDNLNDRLAKRKKKLRKKSVGQIDTEILQSPPIKKQQLLQAQKQITQNVQRFTIRMTQMQRQMSSLAQNKELADMGRIKMRIEQTNEQQQEFLPVTRPQQQRNADKLKQNNKLQQNRDTTIQYETFDSSKRRITTRKQYQQIDDDELL